MNVELATNIGHPIGFLAGAVVYALLLAMVLQERGGGHLAGRPAEGPWHRGIRLPLYIAILGLLWNLASLASVLVAESRGVAEPVLLALLATSALGALPAVAMHSVWQTVNGAAKRTVGALTVIAYGLTLAAALWNTLAAVSGDPVPAAGPWRLLTIGFLVVFAGLLWAARGTLAEPGGLVLVFLAVCSVVTLPLSHHQGDSLPWWFDFLGHHTSLPVAVAVLYRDYRFAFVDHFLKRALSFLMLVGVTAGLYGAIVLPLIQPTAGGQVSSALSGLVVSLWVLTALAYPWVHRQVAWVFDALLLHRPDFHDVRRQLVQCVGERETPESVLDELCRSLKQALSSKEVRWNREAVSLPPEESDGAGPITTPEGGLSVVIPTLDSPRCVVAVAPRMNGRRFLSEELTLVEAAALIAARRIDALRTTHERCETAIREQEMQKLATEAELRALRAQINPHFLFNALNTIGYLIETAPERAARTLTDLTSLLRGMLRQMEGSFTTLGDELELIRSYLDIEQARFEERLTVRIDVPESLRGLRVPALVLQPIVENAVKHGIQPSLGGGSVTVVGRVLPELRGQMGQWSGMQVLSLEVRDTGVGATREQLAQERRQGIGLANVEQRLRGHYGGEAALRMVSEPGVGTTVELRMPVQETTARTAMPVAAVAGSDER